jgi:hypothetical protein
MEDKVMESYCTPHGTLVASYLKCVVTQGNTSLPLYYVVDDTHWTFAVLELLQ